MWASQLLREVRDHRRKGLVFRASYVKRRMVASNELSPSPPCPCHCYHTDTDRHGHNSAEMQTGGLAQLPSMTSVASAMHPTPMHLL